MRHKCFAIINSGCARKIIGEYLSNYDIICLILAEMCRVARIDQIRSILNSALVKCRREIVSKKYPVLMLIQVRTLNIKRLIG